MTEHAAPAPRSSPPKWPRYRPGTVPDGPRWSPGHPIVIARTSALMLMLSPAAAPSCAVTLVVFPSHGVIADPATPIDLQQLRTGAVGTDHPARRPGPTWPALHQLAHDRRRCNTAALGNSPTTCTWVSALHRPAGHRPAAGAAGSETAQLRRRIGDLQCPRQRGRAACQRLEDRTQFAPDCTSSSAMTPIIDSCRLRARRGQSSAKPASRGASGSAR